MGCHSEGVTARRKLSGLVSASSPLLYDVKGLPLWTMQDPQSSTAALIRCPLPPFWFSSLCKFGHTHLPLSLTSSLHQPPRDRKCWFVGKGPWDRHKDDSSLQPTGWYGLPPGARFTLQLKRLPSDMTQARKEKLRKQAVRPPIRTRDRSQTCFSSTPTCTGHGRQVKMKTHPPLLAVFTSYGPPRTNVM